MACSRSAMTRGPHAAHRGGAAGGRLVMTGGQLVPWPADLSRAIAVLPDDAPAEESFRSWLLRHVGASAAEAIVGLIFIATFDHDPGRLSAAFARERLRRALSGGARYVVAGWSTLVGLLAGRAASLGSPTIQADLNSFDAAYGLPSTTVKVIAPAGAIPPWDPTNSDMTGWAGET